MLEPPLVTVPVWEFPEPPLPPEEGNAAVGVGAGVGVGVGTRSYTGAYILAAAAALVIIGAILVMALYMRGKISLGKFEDVLNDNNGDGDEFYNPDDFKDNSKKT